MKLRDPLLYERMIGQYITEEEAFQKVDKSDLRFSTILEKHLEIVRANELYRFQKYSEECCEEEEEEDDDADEEFEASGCSQRQTDSENQEMITDCEKQQLKDEFLTIMQQRFLDGRETFFDYSEVDNNTDYDSIEQISRDAEEKYFDDESDNSQDCDIKQSAKDGDYDKMDIEELVPFTGDKV